MDTFRYPSLEERQAYERAAHVARAREILRLLKAGAAGLRSAIETICNKTKFFRYVRGAS
jgi:hypothetical protein